MIKTLKDYSIHIGLLSLILLILWALTTGKMAGNWESKVLANEDGVKENKDAITIIEKEISVVPVLESQYQGLKEDVGELKTGQLSIAQDIKELLKLKN